MCRIPALPDSISNSETSIRQLIANGKSKVALDSAKDLHKRAPSASTEALLIDAYCARIASLLDHKMAIEAQSLTDLVRQRFPAHASKLDSLSACAAARADSIDALVAPLADAALDPARRATIETAIRTEVYDLAALANCAALPPDHSLRVAAAALDKAFKAVTSGRVDPQTLDLPEVSRRSPLASWKPLVIAIAHYYRNEDGRCREFLAAVPPDSVPARLVPALHAALGDNPEALSTPASVTLVTRIRDSAADLRPELERLERLLREDHDAAVLRQIEHVFRKAREAAPESAAKLRQRVTIRCAVRDIDQNKAGAAMGGKPREDFAFYQLYALGMERQSHIEDPTIANAMWDYALHAGAHEGRFKLNGPEAAEIYIRMAGLIADTPRSVLSRLERSARTIADNYDTYYFFPEEIYQRAAAINPTADVFAPWLEWAKLGNANPDDVALSWHRTCPGDIQPLLHLIESKSSRKAYHDALKYLAAAEEIDGTHPVVRMERVRLLTGKLLKQFRKKNLRLVQQTVQEIAAEASVREGDRPAVLAALHWLVVGAAGHESTEAARSKVETILGNRIAAIILRYVVSGAAGLPAPADTPWPSRLSSEDRASIPAALARTLLVARYFGFPDNEIPAGYPAEAARELPKVADSLDIAHIRCLADYGIASRELSLAYVAAGAGMNRGGAAEARFLLARALSLPEPLHDRKVACAAAAATIARRRQETDVVKKAIEALHKSGDADADLDLEEALDVLAQEKAAGKYPTPGNPGPNYSKLLYDPDSCDCPVCRSGRGELEEADDEDLDVLDSIPIPPPPPGVSPRAVESLLDEMRRAMNRGENMNEFLDRVLGPPPGAGRHRKRK